MFQLTSVAPMLQNKYINDLVEKEKKIAARASQSSSTKLAMLDAKGRKRREKKALERGRDFFRREEASKTKSLFSQRKTMLCSQSIALLKPVDDT